MFRILIEASRILVGSLFIVSGLIKSNDILGFVYKLEEYFEPGALNLEGLVPYALPLAIFIVIGEILLGVAMLIGAMPRLTAILTLIIMVFFTWLTGYTCYCDPMAMVEVMQDGVLTEIPIQCVTECGCFGNAIPLEACESFTKDWVILIIFIPFLLGAMIGRVKLNTLKEYRYVAPISLVLISLFSYLLVDWLFPILFAALCLLVAVILTRKIKSKKVEYYIAGAVIIICAIFQYSCYAHLPMKDYRPYAVGENIRENMKSAEEVGEKPPVYATKYVYTNNRTGKDTIILSTDYMKIYKEDWFKNGYTNKTFDGESIKISDGYEPRIQDFAPQTFDGDEMLEEVLSDGYTFFFVSKNLESIEKEQLEGLKKLADDAQANGVKFYGLVSSNAEQAENFKFENQLAFEFLSLDFIESKIIIRSNPGLVLLKDATVIEKWSWRDTPAFEDLDL